MRYTSGRYTSGQLLENIVEIENWITEQALAGTALAIPGGSTQKDIKNRVADASMGLNEVIFDDNDRPSIYTVYKPDEKARLDYLDNGGTHFPSSNILHPAFFVNGNPIELLIGKYLGAKVSGTNYAVSLRGLSPANYIDFDASLALCAAKGTGHHLTTQASWAFLSLLAVREGFQLRGNDYYGKSYQDGSEKGIAGDSYVYSDYKVGPTLTGSGPVAWHLDGTPFSPADLRGNVREWNGGYRINEGEIQVLINNNAADNTKSQTAISTEWKAIMPDGSLVAPGTAGTLKWDFIDPAPASGTAPFQLNTTIDNPPADATPYGLISFSSLSAKSGVTVPDILRHLGIMPPLANVPLGTQYMRNVGERLGLAGGFWLNTSGAGLGYRDAGYGRTSSSSLLGFRPAFYRGI
jgi:hypothetical protein